uniref:Palmitoyltransferase n=1 Tax=Hucho hucho TaxID=62062 RepID=A0A4W5JQ71_9TELE
MYIALISVYALCLSFLQFYSCVHDQWNECTDFSPPVAVMLMIFLCLEAFLFLTFTVVMFGTQIHSICNDETVRHQARHTLWSSPVKTNTCQGLQQWWKKYSIKVKIPFNRK